MDLSVDPCEDFYNYSCRNWATHNPRPNNSYSWGIVNVVEKKLKTQLVGILEGDDKVPLSLQKARNFYKACMNMARDEMKGKLNDLGGYIVDDELLEKDIEAFIDFEKKLASLLRLSNDNDSMDSKSFTINEMHSEYKNVSRQQF
ncbi:hypothetical protein B4U80_14692 [Leptotrombidium deliense]|uniref:Peptidase M13 N-terminal domain-containing protein n=1 Tax=Leptotrombidium deliense TaxID=299467 RepID=A0A443RS20_9ACAR|nr:hypothetical protein B4U80_14692 [Leptotrombidium deliense]